MERLTVEAPALGFVAAFPLDRSTQHRFLDGPGRHRHHAGRRPKTSRPTRRRRPAWMAATGRGVASRRHGRPSSGVTARSWPGPSTKARAGARRWRPAVWFLLAGAMSAVFLGIMSSDALCPEHRLWVLFLGGASLIAAGTAIVGLIDGWAGAPLLALASCARRRGHRPDRHHPLRQPRTDHRRSASGSCSSVPAGWCGGRAGSTAGIGTLARSLRPELLAGARGGAGSAPAVPAGL